MIEILLLIWLCKKNTENALMRGRDPKPFVGLTVILWIGMNVIGYGIGIGLSLKGDAFILAIGLELAVGVITYFISWSCKPGHYTELMKTEEGTIRNAAEKIPSLPSESQMEPAKFCTYCGAPFSENARFCEKCGSPREYIPRVPETENAVALCLPARRETDRKPKIPMGIWIMLAVAVIFLSIAVTDISKHYRNGAVEFAKANDIPPVSDDWEETLEKGKRYIEAKQKLSNGNTEEAMRIFEELGDYMDSKEYYDNLSNRAEAKEARYKKAEEYYRNQEYYKAKKQYMRIKDYKDAQEKADSCMQPLPKTGDIQFFNGFACSFSFTNLNSPESAFVRLYNASDHVTGQVFIRPGDTVTLEMSAGTYAVKVAYGTEWYGEKDLFGEEGRYQQMKFDGNSFFVIDTSESVLFTLDDSEKGNIEIVELAGASEMQE